MRGTGETIMADKKSPQPLAPETPAVDERANTSFLDSLFDTDGRPNSEAVDLVEIEGYDEDGNETYDTLPLPAAKPQPAATPIPALDGSHGANPALSEDDEVIPAAASAFEKLRDA
jgi:hypothetical protein